MQGLDTLADLEPLQGAVAALVVGLAGSLHCFLMCGPLACASCAQRLREGVRETQSARVQKILAYQLARIAAYAVAGGLLGAIGAGASSIFSLRLAALAPWFLVAALLASAFDLGRRAPPIPGLVQLVRRGGLAAQALGPRPRAFAIGALTPLLPCGLLYAVFAAAASTGSFAGGAFMMGAFSLGAIPALLLAQLGLQKLLARGGLLALSLQRGLPALAACVVAYRALFIHAGHACH